MTEPMGRNAEESDAIRAGLYDSVQRDLDEASAAIGPGPRLAARRVQDVLGIPDGAPRSAVEALLRSVLADDETTA